MTMTPMKPSIIPSKLYRIKIFESVERFKAKDGGRERDPQSDDPLETQINAWVDETKCLIVGTGPVTFIVRERDPKTELASDITVERRTIAITYVPPVEQGDKVYGSQDANELGQADGEAEPTDTTTGPGVSDGGLSDRQRRPLRVPNIAKQSVTESLVSSEGES